LTEKKCVVVSHHFGKVEANSKSRGTFLLRNEGEVPLRIIQVTASCGCASADVPTTPIDPGGEFPIEVELLAPAWPGKTFETISLFTTSPNIQEIRFILEAEVRRTLVWESPDIFFSELNKGARRTETLRGHWDGTSVPELVFRSPCPAISADFAHNGAELLVTVHLSEDRLEPWQNQGSEPLIFHVKGRESALGTIRVHWARELPILASPSYCVIPSGSATPVTREIRINRKDHRPFKILGCETKGPCLSVQRVRPTQDGYDVEIHGTPNLEEGESELRVQTDDAWLPIVSVPILVRR
jgi:hypothetical protein